VNSTTDPHPNYKLIESFYKAFTRRDFETMNKVYDPEYASFNDPVFQNLDAREVRKMWKMLCLRGKDLAITYRVLTADDHAGKAHWEAHYTFSGTGKKVINRIESRFTFEKGLIRDQRDEFDFYDWAKQAFGLTGRLFGWTSWFKTKVRTRAKSALDQFN